MRFENSPSCSENWLSQREIVNLKRETPAASGLPGRCYHSREIYEAERSTLFATGWIPIAFLSDLTEVGGVYPVSIAGWELIAVRSADGIQVFHNICRHRGFKLVHEPGRLRSIVCGYHCWGYDLAGNLISTPNISGIGAHRDPQKDRSALGLLKVRSASWRDVIFVNIGGSAPDFNEQIRPVEERLSSYDLSILRPSEETIEDLLIDANWKIFIEAGIEDYHLPIIHTKTLRRYGKNYVSEDGGQTFQGFSQSHTIEEATTRHKQSSSGSEADLPFHPAVVESGKAEFIAMFLLPLGLISLSPTGMAVNIVCPDGPAKTKVRTRSYFIGDAAIDENRKEARLSLAKFFTEVLNEDIVVMSELQRLSIPREELGIETHYSGHWEKSLHRFHRFYASRIDKKWIDSH